MEKRYWAKGLKRDKQFQIRFSPEEFEEFKKAAKASRLPMVSYARHKILSRPIPKAKSKVSQPHNG